MSEVTELLLFLPQFMLDSQDILYSLILEIFLFKVLIFKEIIVYGE